jgi:hypothetical protein
MDLSLVKRLIEEDDPLQALYEVLTGTIWTAERFDQARRQNDLNGYLREGEHAASRLEREVYEIYQDIYRLLEAENPRRDWIREVHDQEEYTLLVIDALSLRELPLIQEMLNARGLACQTEFALAPLPTETADFCRYHYGASGPSDLANRAHRWSFAFRRATNEDWQPNFRSEERQRFIWYIYPDDNFRLQETDYARHVIGPVVKILETVLDDPGLVHPLVVTADHGYLWQGDQCPWPVDDVRERSVLAEAFRHGRSMQGATDALAATSKAWVQGSTSAARGRFAWGSIVRGAGSLFKHGGVTLLECILPWFVVHRV